MTAKLPWILIVAGLLLVSWSCHTRSKGITFKFEKKECACSEFNRQHIYSADELFILLQDSQFMQKQNVLNTQECFIDIIRKLSSEIGYMPNYSCSFSRCEYANINIRTESAAIFRYDVRQLMQLYHYKDSANIISRYFIIYKKSDSILITNFFHK